MKDILEIVMGLLILSIICYVLSFALKDWLMTGILCGIGLLWWTIGRIEKKGA